MQTFCAKLLLGIKNKRARGLSPAEDGYELAEHIALRDKFFFPALRVALHALEPLLCRLHISEHKFKVDDLDIPHRVGLTVDMVHVLIVEHADDFGYRIHFADVREELVAQTFPL